LKIFFSLLLNFLKFDSTTNDSTAEVIIEEPQKEVASPQPAPLCT
jgi:hypothetical protein